MRRTIKSYPEKRKPIDVDIGMSVTEIGDIFKGIGSFMEVVSEMAEKGQEEVKRTGGVKTPGGKRAMYGFSVRVGGAGIPRLERFGNIVRETGKGPIMEEVREPFVDIFEEKDSLEVIAEMPGVEEKDISYEIKDNMLELKASGDGRKYKREVLLSCKVSVLKTAYKNGVFSLTLKKEKEEK